MILALLCCLLVAPFVVAGVRSFLRLRRDARLWRSYQETYFPDSEVHGDVSIPHLAETLGHLAHAEPQLAALRREASALGIEFDGLDRHVQARARFDVSGVALLKRQAC